MRRTIMVILALLLMAAASHALNMTNDTLRYDIECGNGRCEITENSVNCPNDCTKEIIRYNTDLISPTLEAGENKTFFIELINTKYSPVAVRLEAEDKLRQYLKFRNLTSLGPLGREKVEVLASVADNISLHKVEGRLRIIVEQGELYQSLRVPIRIDVFESSDRYRFSLDIPKKEYVSGDTLYFIVETIANTDRSRNASLLIDVVAENETLIKEFQEEIMIEPGFARGHRQLTLNKTPDGQYYLQGLLMVEGSNFTDQENFFIQNIFWTPFKITLLIIGIVAVLLTFTGLFVYRKYNEWRLSRMRYIPPNFDKIPRKTEGNICVGKIPETTKKAYINPNDLTRHALVAGSTGSGKSVSASVITEEILLRKIPVIVFDPTCQWTGFVKQLQDKRIFETYKQFNMKEEDARSFKGLIYNVETTDFDIDFEKYMIPGEITIFNLNRLKPGEYDQAVQNVISKMFQHQWEESPDLKMLVVFDEVHRLLEKYGGKGGYVALEKACREFRKWGIGLIMVSQVSADFKEAVAGNIMTEFQLNTKSMEDIKKIAHKYGENYSSKISRQGIGVALVQNAGYNNGKPWFIHIRPPVHDPHKISEEELDMYGKYSKRIDELENQVQKLEAMGKDVGNIKLELKLTKDKLKEGYFKMVEIYLSNLEKHISKL